MKVLIDAASFAANISGLQRHALNVAHCLLTQPDVSALHFAIAPWQRDFMHAAELDADSRLVTHIATMERSSLSRNLWHYRKLPEMAAQLEVDVVHLSYPVPVNAAAFSCPVVVTLHDMYPYEIPMNFGFPKFLFNCMVLRQCLGGADAIACVSEITSTRLKQYAPPAVWRKAVRIYNRVEAETRSAAHSPIPGSLGEPFLLCVAQHRRNKNISLLIRSFHRLLRWQRVDPKMKLVVIGITGPETGNLHRMVSGFRLEHSVLFLEGLPDPELQWCYQQCEAMVAPSLTEGFGLPVAEALLAGGRVVCSDIPAHREAGDGHCRFVALEKNAEEALAEAIAAALCEPKRQPISLPQFSAPVLAKQYLGLYRGLIASGAHARNISGSMNIAASEGESL